MSGIQRPAGIFRADSEPDGLAHATLHCATDGATVADGGTSGDECTLDFRLIGPAGQPLYAASAVLTGLAPRAALSIASRPPAGRELQLQLPALPYERLTHCLPKPTIHEVTMGLLIDHGFVSAVGGRDAALREAAVAVSRTNSVYEGQLGIRLVVTKIILNQDESGDYASTGPNSAPTIPGTRSCPAYEPRVIEDHGATVRSDEIDVALDYFSSWVGRFAPGGQYPSAEAADLWHLLTDCFPSPGVVGLAQVYATCQRASRLEFTDSGVSQASTASPHDDGCDTVVVETGNCADSNLRGACEEDDVVCHANTGISSWSYDGTFWHTFAHEVAHNLGAEHTFGDDRGGLMSYEKEKVRTRDGQWNALGSFSGRDPSRSHCPSPTVRLRPSSTTMRPTTPTARRTTRRRMWATRSTIFAASSTGRCATGPAASRRPCLCAATASSSRARSVTTATSQGATGAPTRAASSAATSATP